ncbi:hypothetical protein SBDP1_340004 [Syntrophobacter sp. SbD1]|nr:hypothetical protein SBDP1_340004 [Syntrophobacter sp. SbD1]
MKSTLLREGFDENWHEHLLLRILRSEAVDGIYRGSIKTRAKKKPPYKKYAHIVPVPGAIASGILHRSGRWNFIKPGFNADKPLTTLPRNNPPLSQIP